MLSKLELKVKDGIRNLGRKIKDIALATALVSVMSAVSYATVYVNKNATGDGSGTNWENACTNIGTAINTASAGAEIWVASGVYGGISINKPLSLYGGFAGTESDKKQRPLGIKSILDNGGGSSGSVVTISGGVSVLDNLEVTGGSGKLIERIELDGIDVKGGGFFIENASVTISNCIITDNYMPHMYWRMSDALGAGAYIKNSTVSLVSCLIMNNTASVYSCDPYCNEVEALGGGLYCNTSTVFLLNSTVANNSSVGAEAPTDGNGIYSLNSDIEIVNSIIRNSTPNLSGVDSNMLDYSCVMPGDITQQGTNISDDPLFVDPTNNNYHLLSNSPCIDSGTNSGLDTDLDGNPRPLGNGFDIGCYEFDPSTPVRRWREYEFKQ